MKVIVDTQNYNLQEDNRLLIPFIEEHRINKYKVHKQGLVNKKGHVIVEPKYDVIFGDCFAEDDLIVLGKFYREEGNPYLFCKYDAYTGEGELILVDALDFILSTDRKIVTAFVNTEYECGWGAASSKNCELIPPGKYDWISGFHKGYARIKVGEETNGNADAKVLWGIVNNNGLDVIPPSYHNICNFYDKDYDSIKVQKEKNDNYEYISFKELSSIFRVLSAYARRSKEKREIQEIAFQNRLREQAEEKYWDTYGYSHSGYRGVYSDDAISDAFDGDPGACWNAD